MQPSGKAGKDDSHASSRAGRCRRFAGPLRRRLRRLEEGCDPSPADATGDEHDRRTRCYRRVFAFALTSGGEGRGDGRHLRGPRLPATRDLGDHLAAPRTFVLGLGGAAIGGGLLAALLAGRGIRRLPLGALLREE